MILLDRLTERERAAFERYSPRSACIGSIDLDVQIAFQKDPKGRVTGLVMDQAWRPQRELKKVK